MTDIGASLEFIIELDKLKNVERRTRPVFSQRQENTAEHSWHVATMALALAPYAPAGVDHDRAVQMLLVHDIVEIDCGDVFAYDESGHEQKYERESQAADRLFGLLPKHEAEKLRALWEEFERADSPDGAYAQAIDRFLPVLHNYRTEGFAWRKHGISRSQVFERNAVIERGCPALWSELQDIVQDAVENGMLVDA